MMEFELDTFYVPTDLYERVSRNREKLPPADLFEARHKPVREAWCASLFGICYAKYVSDCQVSVNSGSFPDFFLQRAMQTYYFETTEVQRPGRRRHDEYRDSTRPRTVEITGAEMDYTEANAPQWVLNAIKKKIERYGGGNQSSHLLVYLNATVFDADLNHLRTACIGYEKAFQSIWILTSKHIATLFVVPEMIDSIGYIDGFVDGDV